MSESNKKLSTENTNSLSSSTADTNLEKTNTTISQTDREQEKEIDWHKLAHKLREHNRKLLKKVFQLEQEILENNQALEEQTKRSQSNDLYSAKQAEKINQYQAEISELQQKIVTYQQENVSQEILTNNLNQQLENFQEKIVVLEEESIELKASNKQQEDTLLEKEREIQQLSTRFQRQQQYFLEYKANNPEVTASKPIKAWSANSVDRTPVKTLSNELQSSDWSAPAISPRLANSEATKKQTKITSIAAVQLPRFPHQVEGD